MYIKNRIIAVPFNSLQKQFQRIIADDVHGPIKELIQEAYQYAFRNNEPDPQTQGYNARHFSEILAKHLPYLGKKSFTEFNKLSIQEKELRYKEYLATYTQPLKLSELTRSENIDCVVHSLATVVSLPEAELDIFHTLDALGKKRKHTICSRQVGNYRIIIDSTEGTTDSLLTPDSFFLRTLDDFQRRYFPATFE